jgi:hypothetical protein
MQLSCKFLLCNDNQWFIFKMAHKQKIHINILVQTN